MAISKVDFAGQTLIDLTKDTVTAAKLLKGATAHDKAGNAISGTASGPKPEQEKEITISENGDYPITPDIGKVLSKVLAHVNVPTGGGGGGDVSPFSRIEVKTWTPASTTNTYIVEQEKDLSAFFAYAMAEANDYRVKGKTLQAEVVTKEYAAESDLVGQKEGAGVYNIRGSMVGTNATAYTGGKTYSSKGFAGGVTYIIVLFYGPLK